MCIYSESSSNNRLNSDVSTTGRTFYKNLILSVLLTQTRFIYNDHKCRLFLTVNIFCLSRKNLNNYYTLLNSYSLSLFFFQSITLRFYKKCSIISSLTLVIVNFDKLLLYLLFRRYLLTFIS